MSIVTDSFDVARPTAPQSSLLLFAVAGILVAAAANRDARLRTEYRTSAVTVESPGRDQHA
jgi:hypothetical protein